MHPRRQEHGSWTQDRRISTHFYLSKHWQSYDIFARQKIKTFRSSRPAVLELANRYKELVEQLRASKDATQDDEAEQLLFTEMCEICLWGNATDLSLLTSLTYEDIQKLQGSEARKASEKNILINDLPQAYKVLKAAQAAGKKERRVDIVLDNAGFELYVDLILAGYLLSSGLATHIVLHPKSIPWFVSDVLPGDFAQLLSAIASPKPFYETPSEDEELQGTVPEPLADKDQGNLAFLFQELSQFHAEGQLILRPNRYWTHPEAYWSLPKQAPELHEDLKESELVIFKGDLNYRKLTNDVGVGPVVMDDVLTRCRPTGTLRPRSPRPSRTSAPDQASTCWPCAPARPMSSSASPRAGTRSCWRWRAAAATLGPGSGRGAASGLSCRSRAASDVNMRHLLETQ